ncbi:hypothetical protein NE686_18185 [Tissierella carlieri]|uniref:Uncharacterized protein n=1 Tax=Tissierella carlieri TaxID=689904 RepID=A0ABT1SF00_9FIRM|nr:hypothetical protein [Tissierella carlieri]MCQ4925036.1 hypothetical protein [Tissierella carlieri]
MDINCRKCYFFKNVNIGGKMHNWCFNTTQYGLIKDVKKAINCNHYNDFNYDFGLISDLLSRTRREQRNNKIKRKCQIFRFHYSIKDRVAIIVSRFSHWVIILSGDKEHLFHQNMSKLYEYEQMQLFKQPDFHLHKIVDDSPMAIQQLFEEIENHDIYVLKHRYHGSIKSEGFKPADFGTPHLEKNDKEL